MSKIASVVWGLGFDPLPPGLYLRHPPGTNALGIVRRGGGDDEGHRRNEALLIVHLTVSWTDAEDDYLVDRAARDLVATVQREVGALGALHPFVYSNYAAAWQDPFAGYNRTELERLRRVRRVFDPRELFTELVPGGFKIPQ